MKQKRNVIKGRRRGSVTAREAILKEYRDRWFFKNVLMQLFVVDYFRVEAPSATSCYDRVKVIAAKRNYQLPPLKTLMRRLRNEFPREVIDLVRKNSWGEVTLSRHAGRKKPEDRAK